MRRDRGQGPAKSTQGCPGLSPGWWPPHWDVVSPDDVHQQLYVSVRQVLGCHLLPTFSPRPQGSLLFRQLEKA